MEQENMSSPEDFEKFYKRFEQKCREAREEGEKILLEFECELKKSADQIDQRTQRFNERMRKWMLLTILVIIVCGAVWMSVLNRTLYALFIKMHPGPRDTWWYHLQDDLSEFCMNIFTSAMIVLLARPYIREIFKFK